jgi:glyoxylase-like metal-dependent hydrolase (beta-lactamase superfamily II)
MTRTNVGTYSRQVGDVTVTALLDGQFEGPASLILGPHEKQSEDWLRVTSRHVPPRFSVSCFVLEFADGSKALLDGGCGHALGPVAGLAPKALTSLGVKPEEIGMILVSHAHPDHVVGLIETDGSARYQNAELAITEVEHAYWMSDAHRDAASDIDKPFFDGVRAALNAYAAKTRHFRDGQEAMLGIEAVFLPGHTPGHTGFILRSGSEALFLWADVVHVPGIQYAHPEAAIAFDVNPAAARESRKRAFDRASADKMLVAGIHHDFPLFGHLRAHGRAFAWDAEVWSPMATGLVV